MSWRKFNVLLGGLSPQSALVTKKYNEKSGNRVIEDDTESESLIRSMIGGG